MYNTCGAHSQGEDEPHSQTLNRMRRPVALSASRMASYRSCTGTCTAWGQLIFYCHDALFTQAGCSSVGWITLLRHWQPASAHGAPLSCQAWLFPWGSAEK